MVAGPRPDRPAPGQSGTRRPPDHRSDGGRTVAPCPPGSPHTPTSTPTTAPSTTWPHLVATVTPPGACPQRGRDRARGRGLRRRRRAHGGRRPGSPPGADGRDRVGAAPTAPASSHPQRRRARRPRSHHRRRSDSSSTSSAAVPRPRATSSRRPVPTTASGTRSRSSPSASPDCFVDYYASEAIALLCEAWLGPGLPGDVADQRGQPRRRRPEPAPRLPPRLHVRRERGGLPGARPLAVAAAHAAGRGGPRRHAGGVGADQAAPALAEVPAGLRGVEAARGDRTVRGRARAAAAAVGRRRVLLPGRVPRRRHQPHRRREADGQPVAGVERLRSHDGVDRPGADDTGRSTRCCRHRRAAGWSEGRLAAAIAACAEGYAFPTNLDRDPPDRRPRPALAGRRAAPSARTRAGPTTSSPTPSPPTTTAAARPEPFTFLAFRAAGPAARCRG